MKRTSSITCWGPRTRIWLMTSPPWLRAMRAARSAATESRASPLRTILPASVPTATRPSTERRISCSGARRVLRDIDLNHADELLVGVVERDAGDANFLAEHIDRPVGQRHGVGDRRDRPTTMSVKLRSVRTVCDVERTTLRLAGPPSRLTVRVAPCARTCRGRRCDSGQRQQGRHGEDTRPAAACCAVIDGHDALPPALPAFSGFLSVRTV